MRRSVQYEPTQHQTRDRCIYVDDENNRGIYSDAPVISIDYVSTCCHARALPTFVFNYFLFSTDNLSAHSESLHAALSHIATVKPKVSVCISCEHRTES